MSLIDILIAFGLLAILGFVAGDLLSRRRRGQHR